MILNLIYLLYRLFKLLGFDTTIKPPYKNYKFERTLNSFSLVYLNFVDKIFFKYFFKGKLNEYKIKKEKRIIEIKNFYEEKNINLEKKLNLKLNKFNYF